MSNSEKDRFLLLVESGSTKSDWVLINEAGQIVGREVSQGWNPQLGLESNVISPEMQTLIDRSAKVYFYGAGVSSATTIQRVKDKISPDSDKVVVENDLVATCRAGLGDQAGLAGILGTGCNACYWDGSQTTMAVPSLGYILSDEGGGVDLGKELIRAYFYKTMPEPLRNLFETEYNVSKPVIFENIYNKPYANRYLASFAPFISRYDHEWLRNLVKFRFEVYLEKHVIPNFHKKTEIIAFVGSIAFAFQDILTEICNSHNLEVVKIAKSATEGLIQFHASQFYE